MQSATMTGPADVFRSVFMECLDPMFLFQASGECGLLLLDLNRAAERMTGRRRDQVAGEPARLVFAYDVSSALEEPLAEALRSGRPSARTVQAGQTGGNDLWLQHQIMPVPGAGIVAVTVRDVTQHKRSESRMAQSSRLSSLGEMATAIAHEINNPLAIIIGRAQLLKDLSEEPVPIADPGAVHRASTTIEKTARRIADIVLALRAFGRDASQDPFELTTVERLLEQTLSLCRARFEAHGIDLRMAAVPADLRFECRSVQFAQALLNILQNAFDAVRDLDNRWVEIEILQEDGDVLLRISDSGGGIPESVLERIMEPFFTTKDVGQGTGLGLSFAKGVVDAHRGQLFVDTSKAHTCFVVRLPLRQPGEGPR